VAADGSLAPWLRLTLVPGIGGETQRRLLQSFGLPEAVFAAGMKALTDVVGAAQAERLLAFDGTAGIEAATIWAEAPGNRILTLADADYPQALLECADPPTLIYVKGSAPLLNGKSLAIVGSRNPTPQGEANASAFAAELAAAGLSIVSGLALGIDAAAHRGAMKAGGHTIAVIGTGADRIYPARNRELAHAICEHGAILSEFPLGTPPLPGNFPRRNRLIAGLSRGCLVVEAAARSGSLITARLAADFGREVFAIPGSIHSPLSKGCHQLIRQGAKLVESAQDVLEELGWASATASALPAASAAQGTDALLMALGHDPCTIDVLAARAGLTPDALLAMLLQLELEGHVASLPGGRYQRLTT